MGRWRHPFGDSLSTREQEGCVLEFFHPETFFKKVCFQALHFQDPCGLSAKTMQYMCVFAKERFRVDGPSTHTLLWMSPDKEVTTLCSLVSVLQPPWASLDYSPTVCGNISPSMIWVTLGWRGESPSLLSSESAITCNIYVVLLCCKKPGQSTACPSSLFRWFSRTCSCSWPSASTAPSSSSAVPRVYWIMID